MRAIICATWVLIACVLPAAAQQPAPVPSQQTQPATEASIHAYGDRNKSCLTWTDRCRTCQRGNGDEVHCSNIGIACQPAEITCTRKEEPAKQ
jgi:hypothetical protein